MRHSGLSAAGLLAVALIAGAQENERFLAGSEKVASEALGRFAQLVTRENYRQLGFDSPEQVRSARLGLPMRQFSVGLEDLRRFEPRADATKLLDSGGMVVYPVLVGEHERSSITLRRESSGWQAVDFGAPSLTRALWEIRSKVGGAKEDISIVRIPALSLYFLGSRRDGEFMLTPVISDPSIKLEKGTSAPAAAVFSALVPLARQHNDLPS